MFRPPHPHTHHIGVFVGPNFGHQEIHNYFNDSSFQIPANFAMRPRGHHGCPLILDPPRLQPESPLLNGRLRNRVTVLLPDGEQIIVSRESMHEHLPRTRNARHGAYFSVSEFLSDRDFEDEQGTLYIQALRVIFRHVEQYSRRRAADLFARARFLLSNARNQAETVWQISWIVYALCSVLDQDRGLGSSGILARQIAIFLIEFMPRVEAFMPPGFIQYLFVGYIRIFHETDQVDLRMLRDIWQSLDVEDRMQLTGAMAQQLRWNGRGNNVARMWTALRHLGYLH